MKIKGINVVWLSEVDLTNLNSGEGESNFVDVKKFKKDNIEFPYVSGQAMRYYLKEAIRRDLSSNEFMCIPNSTGETCGNIKKCILCDLFGFMKTEKNKGSTVRTSPIKVSPAVGLLPFDENSNIDFLTRKHNVGKDEKNEGDIVNIEIGTNIYKAGISIDCNSIGAIEVVSEDNDFEVNWENILDNDDEKIIRIKKILNGIVNLSDYSKQARLLTDFTPDIIIVSTQNTYNHRLQKAFKLDENRNLDKQRLDDILKDVLAYSDKIFIGMTSGIINNEKDIKDLAKKYNLDITTPNEVISNVISCLESNLNEKL